MFNYTRFLLVRVNSSHYTEIYLKGYRDAHPINVLLMFQLSFRQMVEGEPQNTLNDLFLTRTRKEKLTKGGGGRGGGGLLFSTNTKQFVPYSIEWASQSVPAIFIPELT